VIDRAVILAAGMGTRLRSVVDDRPKGLVEIHGETLVGRSVRLLRAAGVGEITIVGGYLVEQYERFAARESLVTIVRNDAFAATGSMASLAVALDRVAGPLLVLESDIVYEARALDALLRGGAEDATLLSGPTGAGDEVWVDASGGRLRAMSKNRGALAAVTGEFVGITRLSAAACATLGAEFQRFTSAHGHARMDYETDGLVAAARTHAIAGTLIEDLCWGEIDDDRQLDRVTHRIWPSLIADKSGCGPVA